MKTLSIIMVSYNKCKYIEEAIRACLAQEDSEQYEIIIGDDGSSDGSISIIEDYCMKYPDKIRYFVMDRDPNEEIMPSVRVSNVIKRAFSYASGDYFLLMSADDVILGNDRLSAQIDYLESHKDVAACYCDLKKFWPDGKEEFVVSRASYSRAVFWGCHTIHISCFVFRKSVLNNILPSLCDDTGALFSILKTGKTKYIKTIGFAYRQHDSSIMHEADKTELAILELLLYQDVLISGGFRASSLSRFAKALRYIYNNRSLLDNEKYGKYLALGRSKKHDIISEIRGADNNAFKRVYFVFVILWASVLNVFFKACRKAEGMMRL